MAAKAVLTLSTDLSGYDAGIGAAKQQAQDFAQTWKRTAQQLKTSYSSIATQGQHISTLTKDLFGDRVIANANAYVKAVSNVGGASKLTAAEQARVNSAVTQAIEKYKLLGTQAPRAMLELQAATRSSTSATSLLSGAIAKIGPALAASLSVGAIAGFARSVGAFAGEMKNLSAETGIGVEQLQAFNYVAAGVDLTIQDVTSAITQLQDRLGSNEPGALRAIRELRINLDDIKKMRGDEALFAISDAFKGIADQNQRIALIRDLFGRSGSRMLRMFEGDLRQLSDEAKRTGGMLSKELIDKADQLDSALDQLTIRFKAAIATMASAWLTPPPWLQNLGEHLTGAELPTPQARGIGLPLPRGPVTPGPTADELKRIEAQSEALKRAAAAADAYQQAVSSLVTRLSGAGAIDAADQWTDAIHRVGGIGRLAQAEIAQYVEVIADAVEKMRAAGIEIPSSWRAIANGVRSSGVLEATQEQLGKSLEMIEQYRTQLLLTSRALDGLTTAVPPSIASQGIGAPISDEFKRRAEATKAFVDRMRASFAESNEAALGNLGGLFFGFGQDNREAKRAAEEAEQTYLRIKNSGTATAEELTLAFNRFREAQERANHGFAQRFADIWQGIKSSVQNILNELLQFFTESFLKGLLNGLGASSFGQKLGGLLGGIFGGVGGGGFGGTVMNMAGGAAPALLGAGGGSMAGVAVGNTVYGAGIPGAAGGGAGGFLMNPAFWTNPWTIGGMAAAALFTWGIAKKGWFRGGEEGVQVNPARDKFLAQFGLPGTGEGSGFMRLAETLTKWTGEEGGGRLHRALREADTMKKFQRAEDDIIALYAKHGHRGIKKFRFGTFGLDFENFGLRTPAWLHGREAVIPEGGGHRLAVEIARSLRGMRVPASYGAVASAALLHGARAPAPQQTVIHAPIHAPLTIQGVMDANTVAEVHRKHLIGLHKKALLLNQDGLATATGRYGNRR